MRVYGQYCPVARAAEVLGDRWTLLIARELLLGSHGFNQIERGLPRISRGLLAERLRQLEAAGILERTAREDGRGTYALTPAGRDLETVIERLGEWGARWAFGQPREQELDARLLLWWICQRLTDRLPARRTVVRVDFKDDRCWYWLVLGPETASVCLQNPGFPVDVTLRTDLRTLYEVWLGQRPLEQAVAAGAILLEGERGCVRTVRTQLARLSPEAHAVQAAQALARKAQGRATTEAPAIVDRLLRRVAPRGPRARDAVEPQRG
jgi:DNA-binding HxlR family transcriptional regulator/putative sterol carrier protein